ncbi:hypothetical protein [Pedobacter nanyangensis]|uniref:hypothetical protein n=1 Tax=Pedobacter nanyangensis TaxID=1562389 RepID=UPI000DE28CA2|nr:hypothetical protein [Pedobacter nanyangensis]
MRKLKFVLMGLLTVGAIGYACKKEPVDSKLFVERYLIGKWPLRMEISSTITNGTASPRDTTTFNPTDTTSFTSELKFTRRATTVDFTVDAAGENIKFSTSPDSTWHIEYLRTGYFKLVYTRKETVGNNVVSHIIERDFRK